MTAPAKPPKPKIKLSDAVDPGGALGIDAHCKCGHKAELDIAEMIAKLGPEATFTDIEKRGLCNACGVKGTLTAKPIYVRPNARSYR